MAVKLSMVRTKTITADSAISLDGNVADFCQSLREEQFIDLQFYALDGLFVAFIVYTV